MTDNRIVACVYVDNEEIAMSKIAGKHLISFLLNELKHCTFIKEIFVISDNLEMHRIVEDSSAIPVDIECKSKKEALKIMDEKIEDFDYLIFVSTEYALLRYGDFFDLSLDYLRDLKNQRSTVLLKKSSRKNKIELSSNELAMIVPRKKVPNVEKHIANVKNFCGKEQVKIQLNSSEAVREAKKYLMKHDKDTFA